VAPATAERAGSSCCCHYFCWRVVAGAPPGREQLAERFDTIQAATAVVAAGGRSPSQEMPPEPSNIPIIEGCRLRRFCSFAKSTIIFASFCRRNTMNTSDGESVAHEGSCEGFLSQLSIYDSL